MTTTHHTPILLLDVMSTLVYDPFLIELPAFFGMTFKELIRDKDPLAWPRFERGEIDEETFWAHFFKDRRAVDIDGLRNTLRQSYRFLPGVEAFLTELHELEIPMHTLSNYPTWWKLIEEQLELSRYVKWTFVSCHMGVRKPDPEIYTMAAEQLGVEPERCIFVDDRQVNCDGAGSVGMRHIRFDTVDQMRADLDAMHHWSLVK